MLSSSAGSKSVCRRRCNQQRSEGERIVGSERTSGRCNHALPHLDSGQSKPRRGARIAGLSMQLTGIHHLTAVSADAPGNRAFYEGGLGMRLVKKTVNQDDVSAYHLFYAD